MTVRAFLAELDRRWDPAARMPWCQATGPGYHTRVPEGSRAHQTREAADYALALLQDGSPDRVARAELVLAALAEQQVTDPLAEHYGVWGWFLEEPPEKMAPADWNWADFIGVRLAHVLAVHGDELSADTRGHLRSALQHAALAIFRRNVDPEYTNIAVMGAVTCSAAGELLPDPQLVSYGRRRLGAVLTLRRQRGAFTEYNSPTYQRIVLEELERAALILTDPGCRDIAEQLRQLTWEALAERFHPGTGQLAGPISRAYHDRIQPDLAAYLSAQTGVRVIAHDEADASPEAAAARFPGPAGADLVPPLPCPPRIASRFAALPAAPTQVRTRFTVQTVGTTWLDDDACLGSADEEFGWVQRRPLLGYWRTDDDPAVVLRARMLLNGDDLSAAWCRQAQDGPRVLSAWWLSYDSGGHHPVLDRPAGSVFPVDDLRLVVSLRGRGVRAVELGAGRFALAAGPRRAVVHTGPAAFQGEPVRWHTSASGDEARIEAVLHGGAARAVDFHTATLVAGFALELVPAAATSSLAELVCEPAADETRWRWGDLAVSVPSRPTSFDEIRTGK